MDRLVRVSIPTLSFDYYHDRIVVTKLTTDAKNPLDNLGSIGPRHEKWNSGPNWIDKRGVEVRGRSLIKDTDTGWVHYFNTKWTIKERQRTFAAYIICYTDDQKVTMRDETLSVDEHCITRGNTGIIYFTPMWTHKDRVNAYHQYLETYLVKNF